MKYPVIYIKGKGSHTARFSEMVEGRMYVVGDIGSAMRTLTSLRTDHAFILYEQRDPAADLSDIRLLNSWPGGGIVLITSRELTERERREYLRAGVNSAIAGDMPRKDFLRMLQFMGDYAFTHKPSRRTAPKCRFSACRSETDLRHRGIALGDPPALAAADRRGGSHQTR